MSDGTRLAMSVPPAGQLSRDLWARPFRAFGERVTLLHVRGLRPLLVGQLREAS